MFVYFRSPTVDSVLSCLLSLFMTSNEMCNTGKQNSNELCGSKGPAIIICSILHYYNVRGDV